MTDLWNHIVDWIRTHPWIAGLIGVAAFGLGAASDLL